MGDSGENKTQEGLTPVAENPTLKNTPGNYVEAQTEKIKEPYEEPVLPFYPVRKPYKERYYLRYGFDENKVDNINTKGTLEFLEALGYGENSLKQARLGKNLADRIDETFPKEKTGTHYCDFCGVQLAGSEFAVLKDGRERCPQCSRTVVKDERVLVELFREVTKNLTLFFGIHIKDGIKIEMVNAKVLHKNLGYRFTPTPEQDGRILGVAIHKKDEGYTLMIENGSPRIASIQTMVHELTHIWQYQNWDQNEILNLYGKKQNLEVYEGMAKWVEVQYMFLLGETAAGKLAEQQTLAREDEYGIGFRKYCSVYPISHGTCLEGNTPFDDVHRPL